MKPKTRAQSQTLLAIESATRVASVALLRAGEVVDSREGGGRDHHAERLLPMIDELLRATDTPVTGVDSFAVSIGPGAFTSLRIGLATVKGLAFGTDAPTAAISTLAAMAHGAFSAGESEDGLTVVSLLDARRGELYAGGYRRVAGSTGSATDDHLEEVIEDYVYTPAEIAGRLEGRVRLVGEGAGLFGAEIAERAEQARVEIAPGPALWPTAASVGTLGLARLVAGKGQPAGSLVPRYVRRAEAEVTRTAQRFE